MRRTHKNMCITMCNKKCEKTGMVVSVFLLVSYNISGGQIMPLMN